VLSDEAVRAKAKAAWHDEGVIEIDDTAVVSRSDDGWYVQAWVWVDDDGE